MQLSDILTVEQVGAMREISSKPTFAQIYVPFLSDEARGFISAFVGRKSDENFWKRLRLAIISSFWLPAKTFFRPPDAGLNVTQR